MLKNLRIEGFRAFKELKVEGLTRVNLFVGRNNCGKTSLLEASQLLASKGNLGVLLSILRRRGEMFPATEAERSADLYDVCHLFEGHRINVGSAFKLEGFNTDNISVSCGIIPMPEQFEGQQLSIFEESEIPELALTVKSEKSELVLVPLSSDGGIAEDTLRRRVFVSGVGIGGRAPVEGPPMHVVPIEGLEYRSMSRLWDGIALTSDEPKVIEALQVIDATIEKIAFLGRQSVRSSAGIFVKCKGSDARLPLGNFGDGIKRLLSLSLSVIRASNGYLIVDEIDTGLHHTVMENLWRMIISTAKRLNVQVFATTHSQDCIRSLGRLQQSDPELAAEVSVHRLDRDLSNSVRYGSEEILTAVDQEIEVR